MPRYFDDAPENDFEDDFNDEVFEGKDDQDDWEEDEEDEVWDDDDGLSDVEADAMTLRDAGWGTDEDYFGYDEVW